MVTALLGFFLKMKGEFLLQFPLTPPSRKQPP
jgi:hypothetical protein